VEKDSFAYRAYKKTLILERHRHRYEFNPAYKERLAGLGLAFTGKNPKHNLVEMIELPDHPWFVGCQFHPEFKSRPLAPHPLFKAFIGASHAYRLGQNKRNKNH
jgi:CTP synthase